MVCIHTENQNQGDFCPFALLEISVLNEPPLGHLRYHLTDVPPQPNSPSDNVFDLNRPAKDLECLKVNRGASPCTFCSPHRISKETIEVDLGGRRIIRSEEHTSELQSHSDLVCRLLLEKTKS